MLITLKLLKDLKLKNVVFVFLLLKICLVFGQKKVVVIDAGHGGKDSGAIGTNGIQEKNVVFNVAKEIVKLNKLILNNELDIYLTRNTDTFISLSDRSRLAKVLKADVFVSLHCNHAESLNAKGMEVYVHNSDSQFTKEAIELGFSILNESTRKLGFKKRGVKFADFQVLREAGNYTAVLIEMGFVTNTDEAYYFLKTKNIKALALAILMGLYNYLNAGL